MDRDDLERFAESQRPSPEFRPEDEIHVVENYPESQKTTQKNHPEINKTAQKRIGKTAQNIIDILVGDPHATRSDLCEMLGKSDGTIKEHLSNLQEKGIIQRIGSDRGGYWKVLIRK